MCSDPFWNARWNTIRFESLDQTGQPSNVAHSVALVTVWRPRLDNRSVEIALLLNVPTTTHRQDW
jgi:hypothetical protein